MKIEVAALVQNVVMDGLVEISTDSVSVQELLVGLYRLEKDAQYTKIGQLNRVSNLNAFGLKINQYQIG